MAIALTIFLLAFAAFHDLCFRTIPNWTSLVVLAVGACLRFKEGQLLAGFVATGIIFVLLVFCWLRGWIGGGDMKLLSATAAVVPPALSPTLILAVAVAGGILALLYLAVQPLVPQPGARRRGDGLARRVLKTEARRIRRGGPLPYGAAILAGTIFTVWGT